MPIAASCGGDDSSSSIAGTGGGAATDASATGDGAATQDGSLPDGTPPPDGEVVAFMHSDGYAVLIEAKENATPRNLSTALDALSPGDDEAVAISLDGTHLALSTTRFGCGGWACLAL
ncbi:MAG: hypothetical protein MUF54_22785, partial [Polyangiaceae bacterium]|nr:hypothetical protein [Polyangiaceae bacterium]